MITTIHGHRTPSPDSPASMLLDCHARIRTYADLAVDMTRPTDAPDTELAEAATRVHRYFTIALPLHVADEDDSIAPRLEPLLPRELEDLMHQLELEHADIERRLEWLVPRWYALSRTPRPARARLGELMEPSRELRQVLDAHLAVEEANFLPSLALLPRELESAVLREMRGRRGNP